MENVTYEQALTMVEALPPEDQQRLRQWLEGKQKLANQTTNGASRPGSFQEGVEVPFTGYVDPLG